MFDDKKLQLERELEQRNSLEKQNEKLIADFKESQSLRIAERNKLLHLEDDLKEEKHFINSLNRENVELKRENQLLIEELKKLPSDLGPLRKVDF